MSKTPLSAFLCMSLLATLPAEAKDSKQKHHDAIDKIVTNAAKKAGVPAELLIAICWSESRYRINLPEPLDGSTPSYGICQVKLETAQDMDRIFKLKRSATEDRLRDPSTNAFYAAKYLKYQLKRYNYNWRQAIAAYNMGSYYKHRPNVQYVTKIELAFAEKNLDAAIISNAR
jgi:soluble lytic murein transglycosylase-like protein